MSPKTANATNTSRRSGRPRSAGRPTAALLEGWAALVTGAAGEVEGAVAQVVAAYGRLGILVTGSRVMMEDAGLQYGPQGTMQAEEQEDGAGLVRLLAFGAT